jgi:hypothetical protein
VGAYYNKKHGKNMRIIYKTCIPVVPYSTNTISDVWGTQISIPNFNYHKSECPSEENQDLHVWNDLKAIAKSLTTRTIPPSFISILNQWVDGVRTLLDEHDHNVDVLRERNLPMLLEVAKTSAFRQECDTVKSEQDVQEARHRVCPHRQQEH